MKARIDIHNLLLEVTDNVWFQPPDNVQLTYPCIIYEMTDSSNQYADDNAYNVFVTYNVMYITDDPDNIEEILSKIMAIPYATFIRTQIVEGLYHLYFDITNQ